MILDLDLWLVVGIQVNEGLLWSFCPILAHGKTEI